MTSASAPIAAITASCSVAPASLRPTFARAAAIAIASLAPDVRMTS